MARKTVFIVEDEEDILELMTYVFIKNGFNVSASSSGKEALELIKEQPPDIVILDLMLPDLDGLEVCQAIRSRAEQAALPIIMVTARSEERDILVGLEAGADDYISKPFSPKVLVAKTKTVLRRTQPVPKETLSQAIRLGDLEIHSGQYTVLVSGSPVPLTSTEFLILEFLANRPGWVYSRSQIVAAVHGEGYAVTDRSVDVSMVGLRKKLGSCSAYLETVRGVGYRLRSPS